MEPQRVPFQKRPRSKKTAIYCGESGSPADTESAHSLILGFRTMRNKCPSFVSHSVYGDLLQQPEGMKKLVKYGNQKRLHFTK